MNDSVNSPETVYDYLTKSLLNPIIMQPGEKQFVNQLRQNKSSLEFWKDKFEFNSQNKGIDIYKKSYKLEEIQNEFIKYQKKIFSKKNDNSFRAARSNGHGFKYYKDKDGNVWYCLPEILKELGVNLHDNR